MTGQDVPSPKKKKLPPDPRLEVVRENFRIALSIRQEHNSASIAEKTGFSRNLISNFTAGRSSISYENLLKACDVINVPIGLLHVPNAMNRANIKILQTALHKMGDRHADDPSA